MTIDPQTIPALAIYRLLTGAVVPRPIAFVSTISTDGVYNLAPFSFFNAACIDPPVVMFCPTFRVPLKDTLRNVEATKEFVVNIVDEDIAAQMNLCAGEYPAGVDEFQVSGLTPVPCDVVRPPRVLESRINMECKLMQIVEFSRRPLGGAMVIGEVVRFHVADEIVSHFAIDADTLQAIGRMSAGAYSRTRDRFELIRPVVT